MCRYREVDESHHLVQWFWQTLHEFSNDERILFMRFVSGRSRLPANPADISQRFQIMKVDRVSINFSFYIRKVDRVSIYFPFYIMKVNRVSIYFPFYIMKVNWVSINFPFYIMKVDRVSIYFPFYIRKVDRVSINFSFYIMKVNRVSIYFPFYIMKIVDLWLCVRWDSTICLPWFTIINYSLLGNNDKLLVKTMMRMKTTWGNMSS